MRPSDTGRRTRVCVLYALAGLLVLAGCGSAAGASPAATMTSAGAKATTPSSGQQLPVDSPMSGPALNWRAVNTPPGFNPRQAPDNILVPSPAVESDPTQVTAYACDEPLDGGATPPHPTFWATHAGGAHWTQVPLPASVIGWCNVLPDQNNTQNVLLGLSSGPPMGGPPTPDSYYVSYDGGATTQAVPSLQGRQVTEIATWMDTTYTLISGGAAGQIGTIEASNDGMRTWHLAAPASSPVAQQTTQFWLDAQSGTLIAQLQTQESTSIYTSSNGGQSWSHLTAPGMPTTGIFLEASGVALQPWHLCNLGDDSMTTTSVTTHTLTCSADEGHTWGVRARWTAGPIRLVYTNRDYLFGTTNNTPASNGFPVYELAPYTSTWEERGTTAQFDLGYSPSAALLWALPAPMMGSTDPQSRIFVASVNQ